MLSSSIERGLEEADDLHLKQDFEGALKLFEKFGKLAEKEGRKDLLLASLASAGACLYQLDRYKESIPVLEKGDALAVSLWGEVSHNRCDLLHTMANSWLELEVASLFSSLFSLTTC
jgi:tetratricopeptide (TPR) repeat protein